MRSPYAHARIVSVDARGARSATASPGRQRGGPAPTCRRARTTIATRPEARPAPPLLPLDRVRFVGEAVAAVVAARAPRRGRRRADRRRVRAAARGARRGGRDPPGAPLLHEELGDNNFAHIEFEAGDVDGAFARAAHVFRKRFHLSRTHAAPLEGRGVIADWDVAEGR